MADTRSSTLAALNQPMSTGRRSSPGTWTPYNDGGIGFIPRRNLAVPSFLRTSNSIQSLAFSNPLRLLCNIIDSDVDCALAIDNIITLTTGDVQIVAQPPGVPNASPDAAGTALIAELIERQPPEIGGLEGLQGIGSLLLCCTGLSPIEAVPGEPLQGVHRIWPVDSLSLMMDRPDRDSDAEALQRQANIPAELSDPKFPGYVRMDPQTFFWRPYQPWVDDPYGRANFGAALAEVLGNLHVLQALRDCIDHTAWPRGVVTIDTSAMFEVAKTLGYSDNAKTGDMAATKWVFDQFQAAVTNTQDLKSDDWIVLGANGKAIMMQGGNFAGLEGIMNELRSRIVRGLKQLPVMMAYQEGSTEGHTSVQWQVYARRLEAIRSAVLAPILKAFSLHLRLLGLNLIAVAKYQPIRTTDALVEAQTKALQIKNTCQEILLNWRTNEQGAMEHSGTGPTGPEDREAIRLIAIGKVQATETLPAAGTTQDEADAQATGRGANAA